MASIRTGRGRLPLNALRVLEEVARVGSMARAAERLNVQPSAVSMQLRLLGEHVGRPLVRKAGRGIALTAEGEALAREIGAGLDRIEAAVHGLRVAARREPLVISTLPSFVACWLLPQLAAFERDLPNIDLHIHTGRELAPLGAGGADAAIRLGAGTWPGARAEKLADEAVWPVCSPAEYARAGPVEAGRWPHRHRLIHNSVDPWTLWSADEPQGRTRRLSIDDAQSALAAAESDHGLALVRASVAAHSLASGRVVRAGPALAYRYAFWFVTPTVAVPDRIREAREAVGRWLRVAMRESLGVGLRPSR